MGVRRTFHLLLGGVFLGGLYVLSRHHFLVFHSIAELFGIIIAFGTFGIAWHCRRFLRNQYFLFVGVAMLFVAGLNMLHTLAYRGMGIFPQDGANLPTQLWIATRYFFAASMLIAPLFTHRELPLTPVFGGMGLAAGLLLLSIFQWHSFPDCYLEASGLTPFKKASEYVTAAGFVGAAALIFRQRGDFDGRVLRRLVGALLAAASCGYVFTLYRDVYGVTNALGHFLQILSFYLLYKAVIETGFLRPYDLLFLELKRSEEALRVSESKFSTAFRFNPEPIAISRLGDGRLVDVNDSFLLVSGFRREEVIGRTTQELNLWVDPRDRDRRIRTLRAEGSVHNMECDFRIKSGEIRTTEVSAGVMDIEGELHLLAVVRDITQRKQAESALQQARDELELRVQERTSELDRANRVLLEEIEQHHRTERALQESERQLRLLSTRLLAAQEDERKHVAKEIHDSIGQILAAIKFGMERVAGNLPVAAGPEVGAAIRNLAVQVRGAIEEVRRIQMALRPALLDDLGILATISWFCREYQAVYTDMQIEQRIYLGEDDIPQPLKIVIFRVMQEALNNAAKHSGASVVRLSLSRTEQAFEFAVQDFGKGFEWLPSIRFPKPDGGMGLLSMKERTELSGGSFLIESSPGSGTKILAKWPASGSAREGRAAS